MATPFMYSIRRIQIYCKKSAPDDNADNALPVQLIVLLCLHIWRRREPLSR